MFQATITEDNVRSRDDNFNDSLRHQLMGELDGIQQSNDPRGGGVTDDAGHILANSLGGRNIRYNFFPQSPLINRNLGVKFLPGVTGWLVYTNSL